MFARLFKSAANPWESLEEGKKSWNAFSSREQEAIVNHYTPKVRFLAQQLKKRVPASVDYNDLFSAGMVGLIEALNKFDSETGIKFSTFAESRIHGSMLDDLRRRDPLSRATRTLVKTLIAAIDAFETRKGRKPDEKELVRLTRLSPEDVHRGLQAMEQQKTADMSQLAESLTNEALESGGTPCNNAMRNETVANLRVLLAELSDRDRFILSMSYLEEYSLKEIASVLKVTEGRVSQLRSQALRRLHDRYMARFGR